MLNYQVWLRRYIHLIPHGIYCRRTPKGAKHIAGPSENGNLKPCVIIHENSSGISIQCIDEIVLIHSHIHIISAISDSVLQERFIFPIRKTTES